MKEKDKNWRRNVAENGRQFRWTRRRHEAALLVADGQFTDGEVATKLGIGLRTLGRWKEHSDFKREVERHVAETRAKLVAEGIARKQNRLDEYVARHKALREVVAARAREMADPSIAGGSTGLLVRQAKLVKIFTACHTDDGQESGVSFSIKLGKEKDVLQPTKQTVLVEEYAVDTGLLREMRELEKQIAVELSEWNEKDRFDETRMLVMVIDGESGLPAGY